MRIKKANIYVYAEVNVEDESDLFYLGPHLRKLHKEVLKTVNIKFEDMVDEVLVEIPDVLENHCFTLIVDGLFPPEDEN